MIARILIAVVVAVLIWAPWQDRAARGSGRLPSDIYVWQRQWDEAVKDAVRTVPESVSGLAPLCAEMAWDKDGRLSVAVSAGFERKLFAAFLRPEVLSRLFIRTRPGGHSLLAVL